MDPCGTPVFIGRSDEVVVYNIVLATLGRPAVRAGVSAAYQTRHVYKQTCSTTDFLTDSDTLISARVEIASM